MATRNFPPSFWNSNYQLPPPPPPPPPIPPPPIPPPPHLVLPSPYHHHHRRHHHHDFYAPPSSGSTSTTSHFDPEHSSSSAVAGPSTLSGPSSSSGAPPVAHRGPPSNPWAYHHPQPHYYHHQQAYHPHHQAYHQLLLTTPPPHRLPLHSTPPPPPAPPPSSYSSPYAASPTPPPHRLPLHSTPPPPPPAPPPSSYSSPYAASPSTPPSPTPSTSASAWAASAGQRHHHQPPPAYGPTAPAPADMGDKKAVKQPSKSFGREEELLKLMMPDDKESEDIAVTLSNLKLKEDESNLVTYGPLSQPFYAVNCPFVWSEYTSSENLESYIKDMEEIVEVDGMEWKAFCYNLYLAFLHARMGRLSTALKQLEICEDKLQDSGDDFYTEIMDGMNHCIQASRAHIYFLKGDSEMADDIISKVFPLKELQNPSKAALIAVNASVLEMFGRESQEMALKMMLTAVKLDPDEEGKRRGGWYYTVGKIQGQLRRMDHRVAMPSREELEMLERATKINPLPVSVAALADAYREAISSVWLESSVQVSQELSGKMPSEAKQLYKRAFEMISENASTLRRKATKINPLPVSVAAVADAYREAISSVRLESSVQVSQELSGKMLSEAKQLYKRAFEMDSENASTLRRCGNGLMKLPSEYKDIPLAKQCLEKAISINPKSSAAYQALGTMEDRYNRNPRAALRYYELSYENGNTVSVLFILEARMKVIRNYNPLADIDEFMKNLVERHEMIIDLLVCKGEYLFFHNNDLLAAAKYWKEAILLDPKSECLTKHMSRFLIERRINKPYLRSIPARLLYNVYDCLRYEIGNALGRPRATGAEVDELKEMLKLCERYS